MYAQKEKSKEYKSRAVANSVGQMKDKGERELGFVDNRPEGVTLEKLLVMANKRRRGVYIVTDVRPEKPNLEKDNPQNERVRQCYQDMGVKESSYSYASALRTARKKDEYYVYGDKLQRNYAMDLDRKVVYRSSFVHSEIALLSDRHLLGKDRGDEKRNVHIFSEKKPCSGQKNRCEDKMRADEEKYNSQGKEYKLEHWVSYATNQDEDNTTGRKEIWNFYRRSFGSSSEAPAVNYVEDYEDLEIDKLNGRDNEQYLKGQEKAEKDLKDFSEGKIKALPRYLKKTAPFMRGYNSILPGTFKFFE